MKTEHTAGPWHCNLGNGTNLTHSPDVWAGSRVVATVGDEWATTYQAADIANGRLIAAAPELLAALETVSAWLVAPCLDNETLAEMKAKADAALAKAKGQE